MVKSIESNSKPQAVIVENLPDGKKRVVLHKNIVQATVEDEHGSQTVYRAEAAAFFMASDSEATATSIKAHFNDWWAYAESYDENQAAPTTEERLAAVEQFMALYLTGGI